jgi:hypothetical protein
MNCAIYPKAYIRNNNSRRLQIHTKVIKPKGLDDLRNEKECQVHRMLLQDSMSVL